MKAVTSKEISIPFQGKSMWPYLRPGQDVRCEVFSSPQGPEVLELGEVYLVREQQEWVIHRCVRGLEGLVLKGDWSAQIHTAELIWGKQRSKTRKWVKLTLSFLSMMNIKESRWLRYASRLLLVFMAFVFA